MFNRFDSWVRRSLTHIVNVFVENFLKRTIREENVPRVVEQAIVTEPVRELKDFYEIELWIDEDIAPMAAAFEGEDGLVRREGTYVIRPKYKLALAFHWNPKGNLVPTKHGKFIGMADDGRYLFRWVDHPYVYPKRFLAKSVERFEIELFDDLASDGLDEVILEDLFGDLEL